MEAVNFNEGNNAACSEDYTKHILTLSLQNAELLAVGADDPDSNQCNLST
jgi:hypothetical protein